MNNYLLIIILFIGAFCRDYRKPSRMQRKCFENNIGEENTRILLDYLGKYHRFHRKATFLDYIFDKRKDLRNIADECLLNITRRSRLNREFNSTQIIVKYYLDSFLKDKKMEKKFSEALKKNEKEAIEVCQKSMQNSELCNILIDIMSKVV